MRPLTAKVRGSAPLKHQPVMDTFMSPSIPIEELIPGYDSLTPETKT